MLAEIPFNSLPEKLDEIKLTMILRQEDTEVTGLLDHFLNQRSLGFKVWFTFQDTLSIVCMGFWIALFAFAFKTCEPKTTLCKDTFNAFGLVEKLEMICWEYHGLSDCLSIFEIPAISELCLLPTGIHIHMHG